MTTLGDDLVPVGMSDNQTSDSAGSDASTATDTHEKGQGTKMEASYEGRPVSLQQELAIQALKRGDLKTVALITAHMAQIGTRPNFSLGVGFVENELSHSILASEVPDKRFSKVPEKADFPGSMATGREIDGTSHFPNVNREMTSLMSEKVSGTEEIHQDQNINPKDSGHIPPQSALNSDPGDIERLVSLKSHHLSVSDSQLSEHSPSPTSAPSKSASTTNTVRPTTPQNKTSAQHDQHHPHKPADFPPHESALREPSVGSISATDTTSPPPAHQGPDASHSQQLGNGHLQEAPAPAASRSPPLSRIMSATAISFPLAIRPMPSPLRGAGPSARRRSSATSRSGEPAPAPAPDRAAAVGPKSPAPGRRRGAAAPVPLALSNICTFARISKKLYHDKPIDSIDVGLVNQSCCCFYRNGSTRLG
jgi:hypothetical protein